MDENISLYLSKAMRYCSTREVCISDISTKLLSWGTKKLDINTVVDELKKENFIDEQRYASAFALDKFKFNNWGKEKIKFELFRKKIPNPFIIKALDKIDAEEYFTKAKKLFIAKLKTIDDENELKKKQKIFSFMSNKGFETEIIYKISKKTSEY